MESPWLHSRTLIVAIGLVTFHETAVSQQPTSLPDAAELIARHSALVRGHFDTAAHRTQYTRQHTDDPSGVTGATELFQRRPSELVERMSTDYGPAGERGYDGTVAWEFIDGVPRILTGNEAALMRSSASFYRGTLGEHTQPSKLGPEERTLGEIQFADETAFAVSRGATLAAALDAGMPATYFSKATGLYLGMTMGGSGKPMSVRWTFQQYRDFDGLLVATRMTIFTRTGTTEFGQTINIDEIRWDDVPDSVFKLPEPVRALIKP